LRTLLRRRPILPAPPTMETVNFEGSPSRSKLTYSFRIANLILITGLWSVFSFCGELYDRLKDTSDQFRIEPFSLRAERDLVLDLLLPLSIPY